MESFQERAELSLLFVFLSKTLAVPYILGFVLCGLPAGLFILTGSIIYESLLAIKNTTLLSS